MKKKILAVFLVLLMTMFGGVGCNSEAKLYNNVDDFADSWGYRGWEYYYGDLYSPLKMPYIEYYGHYRSTRADITKNEWRPHEQHDIILGYKAQKSGKATISIKLKLIKIQRPENDGVLFQAFNNGIEDLYRADLVGSGEASSAETVMKVSLKKGQYVWFTLSANANQDNDLTDVNITVKF